MVSYANGKNVWERVIRMVEIMQSIRPKWCGLIIHGKKTIEVRKTRPKCETPFKVYLYQTKRPVAVTFSGTGRHISEFDKCMWYNERSGKVMGEYVCNEINTYQYLKEKCEYDRFYWFPGHRSRSCLSEEDLLTYGGGKTLYAYHISDLKIYDKPLELRDFRHPCPYTEKPCSLCKYADYSGGELECRTGIERAPQDWCYVRRIKE